MHLKPTGTRPLAISLAIALVLVPLAPIAPRTQPGPVKVRASETTLAVHGTRDFAISSDTTHVDIHWAGAPTAQLTVAFSSDGKAFSKPDPVEVEEPAEGPDPRPGEPTGETYSALMGVEAIRVVRIHADRPLAKVTVLAIDAAGPSAMAIGMGEQADGATSIPGVISRAQWGADETIRFDGAGDERWPREYFPLQKLVIHHTAGRNHDPNPAATVRAIYYFHAVTRRWGDIGYNYLIDEAGRIYEGRFAREFWDGAIPSSDNAAGLTVAGGHALHHNQGSMGIAILGTYTTVAPTAAAHAALVRLLAWAAARNGIDPLGQSMYVNPETQVSRYTYNIGGHRDYQATTCPGGVLYAQLPAIRKEVAAAINRWPGQLFNPARRLGISAGTFTGYRFTAGGAITSSKTYTLRSASSAPTNQLATVPGRSGTYFSITAGVWAGYWLPASSRLSLGPAPPWPTLEAWDTARPVTVPAGTRTGYRFNSHGGVIASKTFTLQSASTMWATQRGTIPGQPGRWFYVTDGVWRGYWVQEKVGMNVGAPPPPLPTPIAIYNPPRMLTLAPGTYTGKQYSRYGILAGSYTYTLTSPSSAPVSRYSTLPGQTGNWYYVVEGVFKSYWIKESSATKLAPMANAPL